MSRKEFEIIGHPLTEIEINPPVEREIAQNIRTIITTWRGSLVLDRLFGINTDIIDMPVNTLLASLIMDLTNQINSNEPRAEITSISFQESNLSNGEVIPIVRYTIKEGALL